MTTLIAVQGDGWAVAACDSRYSDDNQVYLAGGGAAKLSRVGDYLLGAAGDLRAINILSYLFQPPKPGLLFDSKLDRFFVRSFIPALRKCFEENGYAADDKGKASHGSIVLAVVNGVAYQVDSDYSWCRDARGVYGFGTGGPYALGALSVLLPAEKTVQNTKKAVRKAVQIASQYDIYTGGQICVFHQQSPATQV